MKLLALGVLAELGLEPDQLLTAAWQALGLVAALAQHPGEARGPGTRPRPARSMVTSPWPSSRLISPLILASTSSLFGRGDQAEDAGRRSSGLRPARTSARRADDLGEAAGSARHGPSSFDEAEEVVAQPGHAR